MEKDWFAGIPGKEIVKKILHRCLVGASEHQIRDLTGVDGADLKEVINYLMDGGCLFKTECACGHCFSYVTTAPEGKVVLATLTVFRCGRDK